ncbi:MAG: glycosyltransferase family 2 protein [Candidatus Heimdallarchaeaceae archaeon]
MSISVIVPIYNESETIEILTKRIIETFSANNIQGEIIFVDDGSDNKTKEKLAKLEEIKSEVIDIHIITHICNMGKTAAIASGLKKVKYDIIALLDGDLQFFPEDIPRMLSILNTENIHFVNGWRKKRKDPFQRRLVSKFYNALTSILLGPKLKDHNTGLKLFQKNAIPFEVFNIKGVHRYLPSIAYINHCNIKEIPIQHSKRLEGKSRYSFFRIFKGFSSLIKVVAWKKQFKRKKV